MTFLVLQCLSFLYCLAFCLLIWSYGDLIKCFFTFFELLNLCAFLDRPFFKYPLDFFFRSSFIKSMTKVMSLNEKSVHSKSIKENISAYSYLQYFFVINWSLVDENKTSFRTSRTSCTAVCLSLWKKPMNSDLLI